ncbi:OmpH family outer membrane protein [Novosphingobium sp. B 225]|uniref:OmpH family outer membrane protein n=1 Tax=Novosphingobium sp. B 225 TaxID=1961849 RepID=UPI000B4AF24D|nr:OmpH family outer membrane protein [Novosphingobium sp. B 225]
MNTLRKAALLAGMTALSLAAPALAAKDKDKDKNAAPAAGAAAAPATGVIVQGIGVASLDAAIQMSDAFRVASQQRPVTYKAAYDSAEAKGNALQAQLKPLVDKFNTDRQNPKTTQAMLQQQAVTIQTLQERGKQDIQQALLPVALSEKYVTEQIEEKLDQAVQAAMSKKQVTLLLQPEAVMARSNAYELTPAIVAELNALIPAAQLVPPTGWEPREVREAKAQQAAQRAAAQGQPAPAAGAPAAGTPAAPAPRPTVPAGPQPDGR